MGSTQLFSLTTFSLSWPLTARATFPLHAGSNYSAMFALPAHS
jgi:hypothetical protein